jgi:hypothetical protein
MEFAILVKLISIVGSSICVGLFKKIELCTSMPDSIRNEEFPWHHPQMTYF